MLKIKNLLNFFRYDYEIVKWEYHAISNNYNKYTDLHTALGKS